MEYLIRVSAGALVLRYYLTHCLYDSECIVQNPNPMRTEIKSGEIKCVPMYVYGAKTGHHTIA